MNPTDNSKQGLKFDESGKLIPKLAKNQRAEKIEQNRLEYNSEIQARNVVHKICEQLAIVTIEYGVEALKPIQSKISPKMQMEIDVRILAIRTGIKGGWIQINRRQLRANLKKILDLYLEVEAQ